MKTIVLTLLTLAMFSLVKPGDRIKITYFGEHSEVVRYVACPDGMNVVLIYKGGKVLARAKWLIRKITVE